MNPDAPLSEAEALDAPVLESVGATASRLILPKPGQAIREDGTVKVAIIRPCISRGKRIRGLPPIYTPSMLAENAHVFTNWPMYRDHAVVVAESEQQEEDRVARAELVEALQEAWSLTEPLEEAVKKAGRSIDDLGGRILRSWFDPELAYEDDSEYGYEKGGVVGLALPLPSIREMLSADPGVIHTSINAWPKSGRPGKHRGVKGMVIEGIRRIPMGSVDWVVRGGAGGRVLVEGAEPEDAREVSLRESYYDAAADEMDFSKMTAEQLREHLQEKAPELLKALTTEPTKPESQVTEDEKPLTRGELNESLQEAQRAFTRTLEEQRTQLQEDADQRLATERSQRELATEAHRLIEAAEGIPPKWKADLKNRYAMTESGATPALLCEAEKGEDDAVTKTAKEVLRERVEADLVYARELIAEAAGRPVVTGQGANAAQQTETTQRKGRSSSWADRLAEDGVIKRGEDGKPDVNPLLEAMEG